MKIGLYFGSFNPVHVGHLIIAETLLNQSDLEQVWLVVSPQNPFKEKKSLLSEAERFEMVEIATKNHPKIKPSNVEFTLPQPSYTIDTLNFLKSQFSDYQFSILMGADNLATLHKWKNYEEIVSNYDIYVYPRICAESNANLMEYPRVKHIQAPILQLSSTEIRSLIASNKLYRFMVPESVFHYLQSKGYYAN